MDNKHYYIISGKKDGDRLESRLMEEKLQDAIRQGYRELKIQAFGQHGIGGRLWTDGDETIYIRIEGHSGQRVGSMGFPGTNIEVMGPASDDLGWLNAGARIILHGNAANGTGNAMAQGKIFVSGNTGSRAMTMTKQNPRFDPPELWVLGSVGDYFGEFMAGGIAVICGVNPQNAGNVLGYRPLVGMVGGKVFFRGPHTGFSQNDARQIPIGEKDWDWLEKNLRSFLKNTGRPDLVGEVTDPEAWQLLVARNPHERISAGRRSISAFRRDVWDDELGKGGLIGDLTTLDRSPIPVITAGFLRRFVPVWENRQYAPPCEATCPTGIPVHDRWRLIREGRVDEAVDLALSYTPFPATICGYLCPNLCMQACTRQSSGIAPVDVTVLGKASINASISDLPPLSGKRIAVIGGGAGGISTAWKLRLSGHEAVIYDMAKVLGGKISSVIPDSRIPKEVVSAEMERIQEIIPHVHLQQGISQQELERIKEDFDFLVIAVGAQKPIMLPIPGGERMIPASQFLVQAKAGDVKPGKQVVVIGAGNVGCDAATEAHRLGASDITLLDIQEPASFGKERDAAEAIGTKFRWPYFTREITDKGVVLTTGEVIPADTVILSVGDKPDLAFLPDYIETQGGFIRVNEYYQTSDPKIFATGDVVKPGLLTDAIGSGRKAAEAISDMLDGKIPTVKVPQMIDRDRVSLEYFDPRITVYEDLDHCGSQCSSCGACRDCGLCVSICPESAISKIEPADGEYEYIVDEDRCIGCGFCAGACPCGVWNLVENSPFDD
jgi:NADPH-dependent glutamate synthase beta subunit-like oxidoreductase/glutamate synthase domain-containing protein 3/Pyruvate/2-oxoacid:ferredoxin oxidoreductase delta subunit